MANVQVKYNATNCLFWWWVYNDVGWNDNLWMHLKSIRDGGFEGTVMLVKILFLFKIMRDCTFPKSLLIISYHMNMFVIT